jgi:hypothetical protein
MKLFLKKIIKKYRDMSVEMKAASWYAVGNIIQKIAPCLSIHSTTLFVKTKFIYIVNHFSIWQIGMYRCLAQIFPCYIRLNNGRHHILKHIFSLILAVYPTGIVDLITIIASGLYSITSLITASTSDVSKNFFLLS